MNPVSAIRKGQLVLIDFLFDLSQPLPNNDAVADTIAHIEQMDEAELAFALYTMVETQDRAAVIISLTALKEVA